MSAFHHTRQDFPVGMGDYPHDELGLRAAERLLKWWRSRDFGQLAPRGVKQRVVDCVGHVTIRSPADHPDVSEGVKRRA